MGWADSQGWAEGYATPWAEGYATPWAEGYATPFARFVGGCWGRRVHPPPVMEMRVGTIREGWGPWEGAAPREGRGGTRVAWHREGG